MNEGKHAEALKMFSNQIQKSPNDPSIDYYYAWGATCALKTNELELAEKYLLIILKHYWGDYTDSTRDMRRNWESKYWQVRNGLMLKGERGKAMAMRLDNAFRQHAKTNLAKVAEVSAKENLTEEDRLFLFENRNLIFDAIELGLLQFQIKDRDKNIAPKRMWDAHNFIDLSPAYIAE